MRKSRYFILLWVLCGISSIYLLIYASFLGIRVAPARWVTLYSPGFSEANFEKVRVGMSSKEVYAVLGKPLYVEYYPRGKEMWRYTRSKVGWIYETSHYHRAIVFSNSAVIEIQSATLLN